MLVICKSTRMKYQLHLDDEKKKDASEKEERKQRLQEA